MSTQDPKVDEYQIYLANKHSKMLTPVEMLKVYVKKATGQELVKHTRLMLGESSEVYDVTLSNDIEVIVRITHDEYSAFGKEKWAIEQCLKNGVPVPQVLLAEDLITDDKFRSICVLEKLKGVSLRERIDNKTLTKDEVESLLKEVGNLLSKIHNIETIKFGSINENGTGHHESWSDYVVKRTQNSDRLKEIAVKIDLDPSEIDRVVKILNQHTEIYGKIKPRLLHGDLALEHIFIDGLNITGIIDWGNAKSGDPVHDFAWWDFFNKPETTMQLVDGYENKELIDEDFELRLNLCKLYLGLDFLDYYDEGNFKPGLEITKKNLLRSLRYFD